ncbi:hypothetical protein X801_01792, partial [Opisthorchis viverrini]
MTDTVDSQCAPDQTQQPLQQIHSKPVAVQTKWSRTKWPKISIGCKTSNGTGVALACDGTHYLSRRPNLEEFTRIYDVANRLANLQLQRLK